MKINQHKSNFKNFFNLSDKIKIYQENNVFNLGFIYLINNSINNKVYIGQTSVSISKRWAAHKTEAKSKNGSNTILYKAMRKYGIENFNCNEIFVVFKKEDLDWAEETLIKQWDCCAIDNDNGYNILRGGNQKINSEIYTCTHCNTTGKGNSLIKYHFDNCKMNYKNCTTSKFYEITFKNGNIEIINNINAFCKHHHISDHRLRKGENKEYSMKIIEGLQPEQLSMVKIYYENDYYELRDKVVPDTAKEWVIQFPDGHEEVHNGLIKFAQEHNLTHNSLRKVADGERNHHKGFKCFRK